MVKWEGPCNVLKMVFPGTYQLEGPDGKNVWKNYKKYNAAMPHKYYP